MGQDDVMKALDYYGGLATTWDVGQYTGDPNNASKYLSSLRRKGIIESIDSELHQGIGNRPKIWIKW